MNATAEALVLLVIVVIVVASNIFCLTYFRKKLRQITEKFQ